MKSEIIYNMIREIGYHGKRDIHYNMVDAAEYVQRCVCQLPSNDPIIPIVDRWLTLRPCKFNRWKPKKGYEKVLEIILCYVK